MSDGIEETRGLRATWIEEAPIATGVVVKAATSVDENNNVNPVLAFSFRIPDSTMRAEVALVCTPAMLTALRNMVVHEVNVAETTVRDIKRKIKREKSRLIVVGDEPKSLILPTSVVEETAISQSVDVECDETTATNVSITDD
jgi:hypothetical protein